MYLTFTYIWKETHTSAWNVYCGIECYITIDYSTYVPYIYIHMKKDPHNLIKCEVWKRMLHHITLHMSTHLYQICTKYNLSPRILMKYVLSMKRDPCTLMKWVMWNRMLHYNRLQYICTLHSHTYEKRPTHPYDIRTTYEKRPTHPYQMWTVKMNVTLYHITYVHYINICMKSPYQMCTQMCTNMYCIWKETHTPLSHVNCTKKCYLTSHYICPLP